MIRASYGNMTSLWEGANKRLLLGTMPGTEGTAIDWLGSSETYTFENVLTARSMEFDFDLGRDLSLNRSRWTSLVRTYLNPDDLEGFLNRAEEIGRNQAHRGVTTTMNTRQHEGVKGKYRWGPCQTGMAFRGGHKGPQPTMSLHSRTSYLSYIGGADMALVRVVADQIADLIDIPVEDFKFVWYLESGMSHGYKMIPRSMIYDVDEINARKRYPSKKYPTLARLRREWDIMLERIDTPLEDERWGARRRVWRRYREQLVGEGPPSCPVETLSLEALYR